MKLLVLAFVAVLMVSVAAPLDAHATSWTADFLMNKLNAGLPWDMAVFKINTITFAAPGIGNISDPGWAPGTLDSTHTLLTISGPARLDNLYFTLYFEASPATPFSFDSFQYADGHLLPNDTTHAVWNGSWWTFTDASHLPSPVPVPESSSLLLVGSALAGLAGASWWRAVRTT
jgi:hypothetical protein